LTEAVTRQFGQHHSVTLGVDVNRQFAQESADYPSVPILKFSNRYTGFGLADFLLGDVYQFTQGAGEIISVKGWQFGLYAQDQYQLRPNLTVNLVVRWDPNTPPASVGGRGSVFVPGQQSTRFPNAPRGMVFPGDTGITDALMPTTYGYVEPRIGFSWQPFFSKGTAVRSGFGIFTAPLRYSQYNHIADIAPFSPTFTFYANPSLGQNIPLSDPWSGTPLGTIPFPPFASLKTKPASNSTFQMPVTLGQVFAPNFRLGMIRFSTKMSPASTQTARTMALLKSC
jgi:outer membrane receptor protein involved in Fe transport